MNLPVGVSILFVGTNVPSARIGDLDSYDLGSVLQRALDVEVLLVVDVLKCPTTVGLLNLPLQGEVRICP